MQGYYLDDTNACSQCTVDNCLACSSSPTCSLCKPGYGLQSGACVLCEEGCQACSSSSTCVECGVGYMLVSGNCVQCLGNCLSCVLTDLSACTACAPGFYLQEDTQLCLACSSALPHCYQCDSTLTCTQCEAGYYHLVS